MGGYELEDYEHRLIAAIYEAALDSTKWRSVLMEVCKFIDVDEASLLFYDQQHSQRNFIITAYNTDNEVFTAKNIDTKVEKIKIIFSDSFPGQVINVAEIASKPGVHYEDFIVEPSSKSDPFRTTEQKIYKVQVSIPLIIGDIVCSAISFHNQHGTADISKEAIEFVQRISLHFARAIRIHNHLSVLRTENDNLLEAVKRTNLAVFLLDSSSQVVFASPEAHKVLASHPALTLSRTMRLQAHSHKEHLQLETILAEFVDNGFHAQYVKTEGISLPLKHPAKEHPLKLCFLPIRQHASSPQSGQPCLAVFINNPERQRFISPQYLQQAYGLTVTETQLAQLLLKGLSIADISDTRGTSPETTRWQMKQIMHKTQTHSQIELARLLTLLTNEFAAEKSHLPTNDDRTN